MNPRAAQHDTELKKIHEADLYAEPNATPEANEEPTDMPVRDIEEPLQPNQSLYREISTFRSAVRLYSIIIANCFCSGLICVTLSCFSQIDDLTRLEKRAFNALSLLLSAALAFGIGFLFDEIGLLGRGTVLQS